ncbi:hypothetical protein PENDEC_c002G00257 [Penicillium decumbens]|uniref:Uncharacterized protein n=1 Tax=Penicillium decumbens TaxID=69771 RepID=A0A1V6PN13_PENDC|nr:hypothetical protein PENDEC_c002G00257 [Penicillium decumbens]
MIPSTLLPLLLLTGWSVGASPTSTAKPSAVEHEAEAQETTGNQLLPELSTGVINVSSQSPSPSPAANEADITESPAASSAEVTETPSATSGAFDNSNPLDKPESAILGGASKISDAGQQAAQTASTAADQTSQVPPSTSGSTGSGDPLGDLSKYLNGAGGLLSPSLLPDLEEVVHDAAYLLRGPTTPNTKTLLGSAFDLLNPSSVAKITSAIHTAQGIITPEVIDELKKVQLVEVFDDIGYLWTKGRSVLGSAQGLVSEQVIQNIEAIIESVRKFLSGGSTEDIENILEKLDGVLPPKLANSLKTFFASIGPFVDKTKPIFGRIENYLSHADYNRLGEVANNVGDVVGAVATVVTPENIKKVENVVDKAKPYFENIEAYLSHANWERLDGLVNKAEGLISTIASALTPENIKKVENVAENAKPYVEKVVDYLSHANWDRVGLLINNVEDLIGTVAGFVTPERIQKGKDAFNNAKGYFYFSHGTVDKARDLGRSVWSRLTPEGILRVSDLLGNAEALLGAAAPLVTPDSLHRGKELYSNATSYIPPDFGDRLKGASNKLGIIYTSIAPGITTPTLDKLGGLVDTVIGLLTPQFANETSSLIGTASGVLTPHLISQVDDFLHSAERMFTPDVRNDTKNAIGSAAHIIPRISSFIGALY